MRGVVLHRYARVFTASVARGNKEMAGVILAYADVVAADRARVVEGARFTWVVRRENGIARTVGIQFDER